ncbi:MAG: hypothetical protein ACI4HZ_00870 [Ruminococcus sp.]
MERFIHERIKMEINNFLKPFQTDFLEEGFDFQIIDFWNSDDVYKVEVEGYHKNEYNPYEQTPFVLLRLFICYEYKQVQISNIFLPNFMRYKGIGKKLIYKIFTLSKEEQYNLFIVDMVDSFYKKMLSRGALPCDNCYDAVQIVSKTKLF